MFVNAIRMTVIPLVVSMLIVGIATSGGGAAIARMGARGVVDLHRPARRIRHRRRPRRAAGRVAHQRERPRCASLRASAAPNASGRRARNAVQSPAQWLVSLVPSNPFRAAADGAMLPLIVFAMMLGLALIAVPEAARPGW